MERDIKIREKDQMKILSMLIFSDPRTQGGIQTFGRTLKKFYPNEVTSLTVANPFKKILSNLNLFEFSKALCENS